MKSTIPLLVSSSVATFAVQAVFILQYHRVQWSLLTYTLCAVVSRNLYSMAVSKNSPSFGPNNPNTMSCYGGHSRIWIGEGQLSL